MKSAVYAAVVLLILGCIQQPSMQGREGTLIIASTVVLTSTSTAIPSTTSTSAVVESTLVGSTTTTAPTVGDCVAAAGFDPGRIVYAYTNTCGNKWTDEVKVVSRKTGKEAYLLNVGLLKEREIALLSCFYGEYSVGDPRFISCPTLYCPATGETKDVVGNFPLSKQVRDFMALQC